MPLDALMVGSQVRQMGETLVARRLADERRLLTARAFLDEYANRWDELAALAETTRDRVAVPTGPLEERLPAPPALARYTALAADGSEIDPDRHGIQGNYYVINIGWAVIPYGQPDRTAELSSKPELGFRDEDLFIADPRNPARQVPVRDRHLDARRTVEELRALADLAEAESARGNDVPVVALVDGTLLFSVLEERPGDFLRAHFYGLYVAELDRLRASGVALAAYVSRTRGIDLVSLLRSVCKNEPSTCSRCAGLTSSTTDGVPICALRGATDAQLLGPLLDAGYRSTLFRVRSNVHDPFYGEHRVCFFLLDTGDELARVEVPDWVARDPERLGWVHAALVDQYAKGQGYPAVLARADDRAVISFGDRSLLDTLVRQELATRGMRSRASAKLSRKQVRAV